MIFFNNLNYISFIMYSLLQFQFLLYLKFISFLFVQNKANFEYLNFHFNYSNRDLFSHAHHYFLLIYFLHNLNQNHFHILNRLYFLV